MEREILMLNSFVLACIMEWSQEDEATAEQIKEAENYELISNTINSVDTGDGGYEATAIIKRINDNKFFKLNYQEWDFYWEYADIKNWKPKLTEVFPRETMVTIYE